MELTMYDKLLQLPLFQGMSKFDFTDILEKVKIHFNKYEPGSCLVRQDTPCNQLIFVLDGEVQIESNDKTHKYTLWENFKSPNVIEPYSLFGMRPYFTASYTAVTEVNTLNIDKSYILNELCRYEVFNLNLHEHAEQPESGDLQQIVECAYRKNARQDYQLPSAALHDSLRREKTVHPNGRFGTPD